MENTDEIWDKLTMEDDIDYGNWRLYVDHTKKGWCAVAKPLEKVIGQCIETRDTLKIPAEVFKLPSEIHGMPVISLSGAFADFFLTFAEYMEQRAMQIESKEIELDISLIDFRNVVKAKEMFGFDRYMDPYEMRGRRYDFGFSKITANWAFFRPRSMMEMFSKNHKLKELDISEIDISHCKSFEYCFYHCSSLKKIKLPKGKSLESVTMKKMFAGCKSLEEIDLGCLEAARIYNMDYMFSMCRSLKRVVLPRGVYELNTFYHVFHNCNELETVVWRG